MSIDRIGSIKDYTPNFKMIIPRFDLATWHDYIEENFRNIDALFFNLFGINNYSGPWKQITSYTEGQVLFIPDDRDINSEETIYSGRLVKVLVDHVTDNSDYFNVFYNLHPEYYELFADAGAAQIFAQQAQNASKEAKASQEAAKASEIHIETMQAEVDATINEFNTDVLAKAEQISAQITEGIDTIRTETQVSSDNAEKSRIWAEGEQTEVQELGGELSSMGSADLAYALSNAPEDQPIDASPMFALKIYKGEKGDKGDKGDPGKDGGGLEIGDIGIAPLGIDENKNRRRYLNGQLILQTQFENFTNWVKQRAKLFPNIITTEENWQAEVTNSVLGQCGKFVIDDEALTIRLPKVVNINGLSDLSLLGNIKAESLPNITGSIRTYSEYNKNNETFETAGVSGAFYWDIEWDNDTSKTTGTATNMSDGSNDTIRKVPFDASRSSSAYQNDAHVQQEAILYPYFIQVATGTDEITNISNEIVLNNPFFFGLSIYSEREIENSSWLLSNGEFYDGTLYQSFYNWLINQDFVKKFDEEYTDYDYVVNKTDNTFRLPIKNKLASGSAVAGNGMTLGLTDGTNNFGLLTGGTAGDSSKTYYLVNSTDAYGGEIGGKGATKSPSTDIWSGVTTDPTKSGIETSTQNLLLYFYVGETIQDANIINTTKIINTVHKLNSYDYVVESYNNGTSWYRVYKSGWVEQGGRTAKNISSTTVTFLKEMANTNYFVSATIHHDTTGGTGGFDKGTGANTFTTTSMGIDMPASGNYSTSWEVKGQGAL